MNEMPEELFALVGVRDGQSTGASSPHCRWRRAWQRMIKRCRLLADVAVGELQPFLEPDVAAPVRVHVREHLITGCLSVGGGLVRLRRGRRETELSGHRTGHLDHLVEFLGPYFSTTLAVRLLETIQQKAV